MEVEVVEQEVKMSVDRNSWVHSMENSLRMNLMMLMMKFLIHEDQKIDSDWMDHFVMNYKGIMTVFDPKKIKFFVMINEENMILLNYLQLQQRQRPLPFVVFEHQLKFELFFDASLDQYV